MTAPSHFVRRASALASVVTVAAVAMAAAPANAATRPARSTADVVVVGYPGRAAEVLTAISRVQGKVTRTLKSVNGASARVPASSVRALRSYAGVRSVTPNGKVRLHAVNPALGYDDKDTGSLLQVARIIKATDMWKAGHTGKGIHVALIDSGVAPVPGLTSGNVLNGPDLSLESQAPELLHKDTFGHGTHMASIIAGRDVVESAQQYAGSANTFEGIAPDARIISLKVAAANGATDVSQVIAAIDWVVQHARDPGFNIRVMNLSFGTDSTQDYRLDPLSFAVENAWRNGIVAVVAAGNDGTTRQTLANPAQNPNIIAVSAEDPNDTLRLSDDTVPEFAQRGTAERYTDFVAPGVSILGLRVPGGYIDSVYPTARIGTRFFRGSGTSQAAAVVSGAVALLLSARPNLTANEARIALRVTASKLPETKSLWQGLGVPDVAKAAGVTVTPVMLAAFAALNIAPSTGTGLLEAARGSLHLTEGEQVLTGERDIFGQPFDTSSWATATAAGSAWTGGTWNGSAWTGSAWTGASWNGSAWTGSAWTGSAWTGSAWTGSAWTGSAWTGSAWTGSAWTGSAWTGSAWTGSTWE